MAETTPVDAKAKRNCTKVFLIIQFWNDYWGNVDNFRTVNLSLCLFYTHFKPKWL